MTLVLTILVVILLMAVGWLLMRQYQLEARMRGYELGQVEKMDAETKTATALSVANELRGKVKELEGRLAEKGEEVSQIVVRQAAYDAERQEREAKLKRIRRPIAAPMAQGWG